jgi:CheY-like chemotaxis protein
MNRSDPRGARRVRRLRILLIEDDVRRVERFQAWLPKDVIVVVARSAGPAIGILERDRGAVYSGILLDHDLQERAIAGVDSHLSGSDVARAIVQYVDPGAPILVHSMNPQRAPLMAKRLDDAGFVVTQAPMETLDRDQVLAWLESVREFFAGQDEE